MTSVKATIIGVLALACLAGCDRPVETSQAAAIPTITFDPGRTPSRAPDFDGRPVNIRLHWSTPPHGLEGGPLIPTDVVVRPNGTVDLLGRRLGQREFEYALYRDLGSARLDQGFSLSDGEWISAAAIDGGGIWVAGLGGRTSGITVRSHAQVAKLDEAGEVLWSKGFGAGRSGRDTFRVVTASAALPSGDVVVAGKDERTAWLARISKEGSLEWERKFGVDQDVSVLSIGENILVAASEAEGDPRWDDYREDLTLRVYGGDGELRARAVVREGMNDSQSSHYGAVTLARRGQDVYLLSAFTESPDPLPYELVKVTPTGAVVWRRPLASTRFRDDLGRLKLCRASVTVLADGSPLVACPALGQIEFHHMSTDNSGFTTSRAPLPSCHHPSGGVVMALEPTGRLTIVGAPASNLRPEGHPGGDCTWFGVVEGRQTSVMPGGVDRASARSAQGWTNRT